ncbi:MAG: hypothetical protein OXF27_12015 [Acidobacteria bacterium]|nr:hypothetical protein [Acidobacteriota bacterium]
MHKQTWIGALVVVALAGTAPAAAQSNGDGPRTSWGDPDLTGVWDFRTLTPIERPDGLGDKAVLTAEEAAAFEQQALQQWDADRRDGSDLEYGQGSDIERAYNDFWWDYGSSIDEDRRTSLIVDPPDGKIPWTPEGKARPGTFDLAFSGIITAGPEDRALSERCILGFNSGPPVESSAYNNNLQMFQTPDTVVIFNEMIHDARIVPLDGRPHLDDGIRQWMGVSRGRWEGDTLVVETTNFLRETHFRGSSANLHLIERFTRINEDRLLYEYTVSDPTTFARPWTVQMPMKLSDANLYEYACHEGNYGMFNLLAGARAEEKEAAEAGSR